MRKTTTYTVTVAMSVLIASTIVIRASSVVRQQPPQNAMDVAQLQSGIDVVALPTNELRPDVYQ